MAQVINTNIASLNAQRNLNRSQGDLAVALQRISSGLRINSAKDDAAGLAISDRLTAQIRGLNQAARNAADAISLAQTGEGALQEITNSLQRMRELAVQSRNDTNTAADRQSIDQEFQQLLAEVDRVAQITAFNGRNVLDGSLGNSTFQVGANVGETISVNISSSMRTASIGQFASVVYTLGDDLDQNAGDQYLVNANGDLTINSIQIQAANAGVNGLGQGSAQSIVDAINASTDVDVVGGGGAGTGHNVTAVASTTSVTVSAANISGRTAFVDAGTDDTLTYTLNINGTQVFQEVETSSVKAVDQLVSQINAVSGTTGVSATQNSDGSMALNTIDGRNIEIRETLGGSTVADADTITGYFGNALSAAGVASDDNYETHKAGFTFTANQDITLVLSGTVDDIFLGGTGGSGPAVSGTGVTNQTGVNTSDVLSVGNSDLAIQRIDQAITDVDVFRGTFGAIQSRFESTIANLQTAAENQSAARSRIQDADFAQETAQLTRAQILQQAGIAILAQANAQPQSVLALLQ